MKRTFVIAAGSLALSAVVSTSIAVPYMLIKKHRENKERIDNIIKSVDPDDPEITDRYDKSCRKEIARLIKEGWTDERIRATL